MLNSIWKALRAHRIFNVVFAAVLLILVLLLRGSRIPHKSVNRTPVPVRSAHRSDGLELSLYLPRSNYPLKSTVPITLSVRNVGNDTATLFYSSGKKFDLAIFDSTSREIWRWSRGKVFTMAMEEINLKKNEELSFRVAWPQQDNAGRMVVPGSYLARGESAASQVTVKVEARFVVESFVKRPAQSR